MNICRTLHNTICTKIRASHGYSRVDGVSYRLDPMLSNCGHWSISLIRTGAASRKLLACSILGYADLTRTPLEAVLVPAKKTNWFGGVARFKDAYVRLPKHTLLQ